MSFQVHARPTGYGSPLPLLARCAWRVDHAPAGPRGWSLADNRGALPRLGLGARNRVRKWQKKNSEASARGGCPAHDPTCGARRNKKKTRGVTKACRHSQLSPPMAARSDARARGGGIREDCARACPSRGRIPPHALATLAG